MNDAQRDFRRARDSDARLALANARAAGMPVKVAARAFDVGVSEATYAAKSHVDLGPSLVRRLDALARARGMTGKDFTRRILNGALRRKMADFLAGEGE